MGRRSFPHTPKLILQGLRGIAACLIVSGHLTIGQYIGWPSAVAGLLNKLPILRLVVEGQPIISTFFILSGFVCSLKGLRLCNAGKTQDARAAIASSAIRRFPRLMIPAMLATIISWILEQMEGYTTGRWTSPPPALVHRTTALFSALVCRFG